jgi:hypothetical protein
MKIAAASLLMGVAAWSGEIWLREVLIGDGVLMRAARLFAAIGGSIGVLAASAWVLRIEEFNMALARVRSKVGL